VCVCVCVTDVMHMFVAIIAPLLSIIRSFHYIMYYRLFPRSLLLLEYPEDVRRKILRNIGTYRIYSRKLGAV